MCIKTNLASAPRAETIIREVKKMAGIVQANRNAPSKGKWERTREHRFKKGQISERFNPPRRRPKNKT